MTTAFNLEFQSLKLKPFFSVQSESCLSRFNIKSLSVWKQQWSRKQKLFVQHTLHIDLKATETGSHCVSIDAPSSPVASWEM